MTKAQKRRALELADSAMSYAQSAGVSWGRGEQDEARRLRDTSNNLFAELRELIQEA